LEDISTVQTIDAMAFKLVLEKGKDHFRNQVLPKEAAKIASQVCETLEPFFIDTERYYPHPRDQRRYTLRTCAESLLRLKFELLLTSKQYEITWPLAGTPFETDTMQRTEERYDGQFVELCVCPGLVEYDTQPIAQLGPDEYASVLMCNKTFFPGRKIARNNRVVVAKSVVLLE
jgi:hypothetical protein